MSTKKTDAYVIIMKAIHGDIIMIGNSNLLP